MKTEEMRFSSTGGGIKDAYGAPEQSAHSTDVNFFTSMLDSPSSKNTTATRTDASPLLVEASKHLSASRDGFAKVVRSTKKGLDHEIISTFPRELHNAQLTSQLMVKCLAKTTQSMDKICNMQS